MTARAPRFEVVQSDAGWFARFRAANGRIVFTSEVYTRRRSAASAIAALAAAFGYPEWRGVWTEVRDVDERTAVTS